MSEEQFKAFQEAVKADEGLQEKLIVAEDADAVVAIAKAEGFVISLDELEAAVLAAVSVLAVEPSDEELESITGGRLIQDKQGRVVAGMIGGWAAAAGYCFLVNLGVITLIK